MINGLVMHKMHNAQLCNLKLFYYCTKFLNKFFFNILNYYNNYIEQRIIQFLNINLLFCNFLKNLYINSYKSNFGKKL